MLTVHGAERVNKGLQYMGLKGLIRAYSAWD